MGQYSKTRGRGGKIQKISLSFLAFSFLVELLSLSPVQFRLRGRRLLILLVEIVNMTNHSSGERMMKSGGLEGCKRQCVQ